MGLRQPEAAISFPMTVHCPHCLTGYELPRTLMGEHGVRVRCPSCQGVFVVLPEGHASAEAGGSALPDPASHAASGHAGPAGAIAIMTAPAVPAGAVTDLPAPPDEAYLHDPALVAGAVLDVMVDFLGDALVRSRERGTVLSDHGPAIIAVWDEYRRRAGAEAPAAEFRIALKQRCGVDLTPRG